MKKHILIRLVIVGIFLVFQSINSQRSFSNDSIQYKLELEKTVFSENEPIKLKLIAKNISSKKQNVWIYSVDYPVGKKLKLNDSNGESMISQYYSHLSSRIYTKLEVEKMKSLILPNAELSKDYYLKRIVKLKKPLAKGKYELIYDNSEPITIVVK